MSEIERKPPSAERQRLMRQRRELRRLNRDVSYHKAREEYFRSHRAILDRELHETRQVAHNAGVRHAQAEENQRRTIEELQKLIDKQDRELEELKRGIDGRIASAAKAVRDAELENVAMHRRRIEELERRLRIAR